DLNQASPCRLRTLPAFDYIDDDRLPFAEPVDGRPLKSRDVDKHVLPAAIRSDETVAPLGVKPAARGARPKPASNNAGKAVNAKRIPTIQTAAKSKPRVA